MQVRGRQLVHELTAIPCISTVGTRCANSLANLGLAYHEHARVEHGCLMAHHLYVSLLDTLLGGQVIHCYHSLMLRTLVV